MHTENSLTIIESYLPHRLADLGVFSFYKTYYKKLYGKRIDEKTKEIYTLNEKTKEIEILKKNFKVLEEENKEKTKKIDILNEKFKQLIKKEHYNKTITDKDKKIHSLEKELQNCKNELNPIIDNKSKQILNVKESPTNSNNKNIIEVILEKINNESKDKINEKDLLHYINRTIVLKKMLKTYNIEIDYNKSTFENLKSWINKHDRISEILNRYSENFSKIPNNEVPHTIKGLFGFFWKKEDDDEKLNEKINNQLKNVFKHINELEQKYNDCKDKSKNLNDEINKLNSIIISKDKEINEINDKKVILEQYEQFSTAIAEFNTQISQYYQYKTKNKSTMETIKSVFGNNNFVDTINITDYFNNLLEYIKNITKLHNEDQNKLKEISINLEKEKEKEKIAVEKNINDNICQIDLKSAKTEIENLNNKILLKDKELTSSQTNCKLLESISEKYDNLSNSIEIFNTNLSKYYDYISTQNFFIKIKRIILNPKFVDSVDIDKYFEAVIGYIKENNAKLDNAKSTLENNKKELEVLKENKVGEIDSQKKIQFKYDVLNNKYKSLIYAYTSVYQYYSNDSRWDEYDSSRTGLPSDINMVYMIYITSDNIMKTSDQLYFLKEEMQNNTKNIIDCLISFIENNYYNTYKKESNIIEYIYTSEKEKGHYIFSLNKNYKYIKWLINDTKNSNFFLSTYINYFKKVITDITILDSKENPLIKLVESIISYLRTFSIKDVIILTFIFSNYTSFPKLKNNLK